jgi:hypothetical protein
MEKNWMAKSKYPTVFISADEGKLPGNEKNDL